MVSFLPGQVYVRIVPKILVRTKVSTLRIRIIARGCYVPCPWFFPPPGKTGDATCRRTSYRRMIQKKRNRISLLKFFFLCFFIFLVRTKSSSKVESWISSFRMLNSTSSGWYIQDRHSSVNAQASSCKVKEIHRTRKKGDTVHRKHKNKHTLLALACCCFFWEKRTTCVRCRRKTTSRRGRTHTIMRCNARRTWNRSASPSRNARSKQERARCVCVSLNSCWFPTIGRGDKPTNRRDS